MFFSNEGIKMIYHNANLTDRKKLNLALKISGASEYFILTVASKCVFYCNSIKMGKKKEYFWFKKVKQLVRNSNIWS
jgi:hypothetical protein